MNSILKHINNCVSIVSLFFVFVAFYIIRVNDVMAKVISAN